MDGALVEIVDQETVEIIVIVGGADRSITRRVPLRDAAAKFVEMNL